MKRLLLPVVFGLTLLLSACADSSTTPTDPNATPVPRQSSSVTVSLKVTGDVSAGQSEYGVLVDGIKAGAVKPNSAITLTLTAEIHHISLQTSGLFGQEWCANANPGGLTVDASRFPATNITFSLSCSPLTGGGYAGFLFLEPGATTKQDVLVTLTRINGSPVTVTFWAKGDIQASVAVPAGMYRVSAAPNPGCRPQYVYYLFGYPMLIVRDGRSVQTTVTLDCD